MNFPTSLVASGVSILSPGKCGREEVGDSTSLAFSHLSAFLISFPFWDQSAYV